MATAETKPKKVRKTLGDLLMQSAQEQLRASDAAERIKRLEDVAPPVAAPLPDPLVADGQTDSQSDVQADSQLGQEAARETPGDPVPAMAAGIRPDRPDCQAERSYVVAAGPSVAVPNGVQEPVAPYHLNRAPLSSNNAAATEHAASPPVVRSVQEPVQRSDSSPDWRSDARSDARADGRMTGQTAGQTDALSLGRTPGRTLDRSGDHTPSRTGAHTDGETPSRMDAQASDRSDARSKTRSNAISAFLTDARTGNQSGVRSIGNPSPAESLTAKQHAVLSFLLEHRPRIINCMTIAAYVGGSEDSVRSILTRLRKGGFLEYSKTKIGSMQGLSFRYNEPLCATVNDARSGTLSGVLTRAHIDDRSGGWTSERTGALSGALSGARSYVGTTDGTNARSDNQSANNSDARPVCQPDWRSDVHHTDDKIDRKNLSILNDKTPKGMLLGLTEEDIAFFWPNLAKVDFRKAQIVQIVERLETLHTPMDDVRKSLDHADYELGAGPLKDAKGNLVADPRSYIFHAIAKTGYYRRPQGYVSTQEQAELDAAEEARRLAKAKAEREEAEYQSWRIGLDPETVQTLLEGRRGPEEVWLRTKWREKRRAGDL